MGTYDKEQCLERIELCKTILSNIKDFDNFVNKCTFLFWVCTLLAYKACYEKGILNNSSVVSVYGNDFITAYRNAYAHGDKRFYDEGFVNYVISSLGSIKDDDVSYYLSKLN